MKSILIKLNTSAQFHFGEAGIDNNTSLVSSDITYRSDTLCAALVATAAKLGYADQMVLLLSERLRLSSCSYCWEYPNSKKPVYFLPTPVTFFHSVHRKFKDSPQSTFLPKKFKKVAFISKGVWQAGFDAAKMDTEYLLVGSQFLVLRAELPGTQNTSTGDINTKIIDQVTLPKVRVHTTEPDGGFYYQGNLVVQPFMLGSLFVKVHFYFLCDGLQSLSEEETRIFEMVLNVLKDDGIGGDRSAGCGTIAGVEISKSNWTMSIKNNTKFFSSLSLTIPATLAEFEKFCDYKLVTRGGRRLGIGDDEDAQSKNLLQIMTLQEGSVCTSKAVNGAVANLSPGTVPPHLRFGRPLLLPLHPDFSPENVAV